MRDRFGIERCCCDCIKCQYCGSGLASREMWVTVSQAAAPNTSGSWYVVNTSECTWESTDADLPVRVLLQVTDTKATIQVSNDDFPGTVSLWEFVHTSGTGPDCDHWANGSWTCKEDTGTFACDAADSAEVIPIQSAEIADGEGNLVTDGEGNIIEGVTTNFCTGDVTCQNCPGNVAPNILYVELTGYVDDGDGQWSVLNGIHALPWLNNSFECNWSVNVTIPGYSGRPTSIFARILWQIGTFPNDGSVQIDVFRTGGVTPDEQFFQLGSLPDDCFAFDNFNVPGFPPHTATLWSSAPAGMAIMTTRMVGFARGAQLKVPCPNPNCNAMANKRLVCRTNNEWLIKCEKCGHREVEKNG